MQNMTQTLIRKEILASLALIAIFILPAVTFAGSKKIYVDDSASGSEDGSSDHPYNTITEGLKKAKKGYEVHVRSGSYKENITIKEDIKLYGAGRDKVTITADDDDVPVVFMEDETKIDGVKIRKGRNGIEIERDSEASIINCTIEDNDRDGVRIRKHAKVNDGEAVSIDDTIIRDNGKAGIYSEAHRVVITDSQIQSNDKDGIILSSSVSAWLSGNDIKNNGGSGLKLTLDGANIWTKSNSVAHNGREGVEVESYGGSGRIDLKKAKIHDNGRWGVARVKRANTYNSVITNGLTIQSDTEFWGNKFGNTSSIIPVF